MDPLAATGFYAQEGKTPTGRRVVVIVVPLRVHPYVRQTHVTRFTRDHHGDAARQYNKSQNAIREIVKAVMQSSGIEPFGKVGLALSVMTWHLPVKEFRRRSLATKGRDVLMNNPDVMDLGNLVKAVEDALNSVMWHDDRQVVEYGPSAKQMGVEDRLAFMVMEHDRSTPGWAAPFTPKRGA